MHVSKHARAGREPSIVLVIVMALWNVTVTRAQEPAVPAATQEATEPRAVQEAAEPEAAQETTDPAPANGLADRQQQLAQTFARLEQAMLRSRVRCRPKSPALRPAASGHRPKQRQTRPGPDGSPCAAAPAEPTLPGTGESESNRP